MSTRGIDTRGEKALGLFLDKYFYSVLKQNGDISAYTRNYDVLSQKRGVDVLVQTNNANLNVDEKAQLYSINKPLKSFVVEIDFINPDTGLLTDGWFMSSHNITDVYLFSWIHRASTNLIHRIVSKDFEEVEVALVEKKEIQKYLQKVGYTDKQIREKAKQIRENKLAARSIGGNGFHFSYTQNREELPINIILDKSLIDTLSVARYTVMKESVVRID